MIRFIASLALFCFKLASILEDAHYSGEATLLTEKHAKKNGVVHKVKLPDRRPTSATIVSSRITDDVDNDTVPRVINELLHTHVSPVASSGHQIITHSADTAGSAQSGTWAHTRYRACPITTDQQRDNIRMHTATTNYNPSSYVEKSTVRSRGSGCGNYTALLDDKRTMPANAWRMNDYRAASGIKNGEIGVVTTSEVSVVTTAGDRFVTKRGGQAGDIQAGYIQEGDPEHNRMSLAPTTCLVPLQGL